MDDCGTCEQLLKCGGLVGEDAFRIIVATALCQGNFQLLCNPDTGAPVLVRTQTLESGEPVPAFNLDGTPYADDVTLLIACVGAGGGGGSGGTFTLPEAAAFSNQTVVGVLDANTSIIAANGARKGLIVTNVSDDDVFIFGGAVATLALPSRTRPGAEWVAGIPGTVIYTGAVHGIHASAGNTKNVEVREW